MATRAQDVYESLSIFDKGLTVWTTTYTSTDVVALTDSLTRHWLQTLATSLYDLHLLKWIMLQSPADDEQVEAVDQVVKMQQTSTLTATQRKRWSRQATPAMQTLFSCSIGL